MLAGWVAITSSYSFHRAVRISSLNGTHFCYCCFVCLLFVCLFLFLFECIGKRRGKGKPKTKDKMIPVEIIEGPWVVDPFWSCR